MPASAARSANAAWRRELAAGIPLPERMFCSPMTRALGTCALTFDGILPETGPKPVIVEVSHRDTTRV